MGQLLPAGPKAEAAEGQVAGVKYLCLRHWGAEAAVVTDRRLGDFSERHKIELDLAGRPATGNVGYELSNDSYDGVIFVVDQGWVNRWTLSQARRLLKENIRVHFYWPAEQAIEVIDRHAWRRHAKIFLLVMLWRRLRGRLPYWRAPEDLEADISTIQYPSEADFEKAVQARLDHLSTRLKPAAFVARAGAGRIFGTGLYLRVDYWNRLRAGGSYGHTCYVAKALHERSQDLICAVGAHYPLLDQMGLRQVVIPRSAASDEAEMLNATDYYYARLKPMLEAVRPAYIYERLVLGNFAGARLSADLGIPYLVEYNGSEISMLKSYSGRTYRHEKLLTEAERLAFRQATAINVISERVREQLLAQGIDDEKILVNPNGADINDYQPADEDEKRALRAAYGWGDEHVVIGFIGTFGFWHGIEILADSLVRICVEAPNARFLIIGTGNLYHLVTDAIQKHGLADRVVLTGMLPQEEARVQLRACDIYVSPHSRDMVDGKFFGSPTKLFEYMALGGAIVASDLEQIGEVLQPAIGPDEVATHPLSGDERAVLCRPGDLEQFVSACLGLIKRPALREMLGKNARRAIHEHYTWDTHVSRLLDFAVTRVSSDPAMAVVPLPGVPVQTGDDYKDEVQNQWDNDPCGSHYVEDAENRLDFFIKVEKFRYDEYAPWMHETMEFSQHKGECVLEIGAGMGTDLAQFARHGAIVTDFDLSSGHLALARENFALRNLQAEFIHGDAETLPFSDNSFDVVYSNGVIHHTPNTAKVIAEIHRVLRPGGKAIIMVYRENSIQFWRDIVFWRGLAQGQIGHISVGEIMSRNVEISTKGARPLVKVYSSARLREMFASFDQVEILRRQLMQGELPMPLRFLPTDVMQRLIGWNFVIKARKSK